MKTIFSSVVAVFAFSGLAMASITPALDGGAPTGPVAGVWTWTYSISVDSNESLNPTANAGATCLGGQTPCNTFWTLYDVGGLISSTESTPGGWGWVENAVGITPSGQLITDSCRLPQRHFLLHRRDSDGPHHRDRRILLRIDNWNRQHQWSLQLSGNQDPEWQAGSGSRQRRYSADNSGTGLGGAHRRRTCRTRVLPP